MILGTTPTHTFTLPLETDLCKEIRIIYAQDDQVVLVKTLSQCNAEGNVVTVRLSQEDTLRFNCKKLVQIQVRVLTKNDEALASFIKLVDPYQCLESEVMK